MTQQNDLSNSKYNRNYAFDFFRAYGCLAIILLHVIDGWKDDPNGSIMFFQINGARLIFDNVIVPMLVRFVVPIFFIMSGALFLNLQKEITLKTIKRHILKILLILGTWGYLFCKQLRYWAAILI